jgi:glutathione synthase
MRVLVVMDDPARLNPDTDTTLVIMEALRRRGATIDFCVAEQLTLDRGETMALTFEVTSLDHSARPPMAWSVGTTRALADYDAVLMRKDPPFDLDFYFATQLLERARGKTLLVNDPRGLREANEKLYIFNFPDLIAPTRVTRSIAELRRFLDDEGGQMIVKPLDGCGGMGVFHVRKDDRNTNAILETATDCGRKLVMAQHYLPEARQGDKRIILLDGEAIGAVLRVPRGDETRGNLHVGGTATRTELSPRDQEICRQVGARCKADGLYFVGLDVIGGFLTEVNVTSPTGIQEIDRLDGVKLEDQVAGWLLEKCAA